VMSHHCVTDHRGSFSQSNIKAQYKNENIYWQILTLQKLIDLKVLTNNTLLLKWLCHCCCVSNASDNFS
jgi:hypothetical protein